MNRKNLIIGALTLLAVVAMASTTYLAWQTRVLKQEIVSEQVQTEKRIARLEDSQKNVQPAKATDMNSAGAKSVQQAENKTTSEPVTQFMSEDELLANFFASPAAPAGDPNAEHFVVITPEAIDLGTISKKEGLVQATFNIRNQGNATVTLNYALTSCGCTATSLKEDTELEPGGSFPLNVSYDPNFYGPSYELGPITKSVTVISNDPAQPFYKVSLKATVIP